MLSGGGRQKSKVLSASSPGKELPLQEAGKAILGHQYSQHTMPNIEPLFQTLGLDGKKEPPPLDHIFLEVSLSNRELGQYEEH